MFTDKLVETARELVSNFKSIHPELGIASTPGRDVQVPTSVNRTLEQILRSIDQGADKGELVPRIIEQLVQTSPVEKGAGGGTTKGPLSWPTYDPENNHALIEIEAGITIHDLNKTLEQRDLGLMNMGGYDGQTIIGATSTSTHGSGITLPPFPDMVRSLVLATTGR